MGDEVGALEEQKYVTQTLTLQGAVQRDPVGVLPWGGRHTLCYQIISKWQNVG